MTHEQPTEITMESEIDRILKDGSLTLKLNGISYPDKPKALPEKLRKALNLRKLTLVDMTIDSLALLAKMPWLEEIVLSSVNSDMAEFLPLVPQITNLKKISLDFDSEKCVLPQNWRAMKNLRGLSLEYVESGGLPDVITELTGLESFSCNKCMPLGDQDFLLLAKLPRLRHLRQEEPMDWVNEAICVPDPDRLFEDDPAMVWMPPDYHLPKEIGLLQRLETLELISNVELVSLPESISDLKNLRRLDLTMEDFLSWIPRLGELPQSLFNLPKLESLSVRGNYQLHSLPDHIEKCANLKELNFAYTNIKEVDFSDAQFNNLASLSISCDFPDLARCVNLEKLAICETMTVWPEIPEARVAIEYNREYLSGLTRLENLRLYGYNHTLHETEFITDFPMLRSLRLCCDCKSLPDDMNKLQLLEKISIYVAPSLQSLPASLALLPHLREIECKDTAITEIPADLLARKDIEITLSNQHLIKR